VIPTESRLVSVTGEIVGRIPEGIHPAGFEPLTDERLRDLIRKIVSGLKPEKIILFGSYAYGNPTPDSDLDILIIMESKSRPAERALQVSRLIRPRPFPMDILVRTPGEIAQAQAVGDSFISHILQRGKIIYDRGE